MWANFFIAAAGASAALAGLVFVALSVNISHILEARNLPPRAAATIGMLILILVTSMAALIPQRAVSLGLEIVAFGLYGCWLEVVSAWHGITSRAEFHRPRWESVLNAVLGQMQVLPFLIGGVLLFGGRDAGFFWLAGGCLAIFIFSVLNAWVLLVEILR